MAISAMQQSMGLCAGVLVEEQGLVPDGDLRDAAVDGAVRGGTETLQLEEGPRRLPPRIRFGLEVALSVQVGRQPVPLLLARGAREELHLRVPGQVDVVAADRRFERTPLVRVP